MEDGELKNHAGGAARPWARIGALSGGNSFAGAFDGGGHTVSGIYCSGGTNLGLFGNIRTAVVKNVGVEASFFKGSNIIGGVVGNCVSSTVQNCYNSGSVVGFGAGSEGNAGGVVGSLNGASAVAVVENCYNKGSVSSNGGAGLGGVVGNISGATATIRYCYNTGSVTASSAINYVGAVAGNATTILDCYYDSQTSIPAAVGRGGAGAGDDAGGAAAGKLTSEMKIAAPTATEFTGWDTDTVWLFTAGLYPRLMGINYTVTFDPAGGATTTVGTGVGNTVTFTVTFPEIGRPGALAFSSAAYSVAENGTSVTITVNRSGGSDGAVTVDYATSDDTAAAGSDYTSASGTLNFANGETSKTFTINITNDADVEGSETVNLALSNPTGGATLGAQDTAVLTITEPGTVTFSSNGLTYSTKTVNAGESIGAGNFPSDPTRGSYTFGGWFTGENGAGTPFTSATPVNTTLTVYAK